jgi:hypothetical protein
VSRTTIGWLLLVAGVAIQVATGFSQADAQVNNVTTDQTTFGAIVGPLNKISPVPLGYALMGAGAIALWVME